MLTPEQITALRDWAGHITDPINDFLIEDIARRIAEAGQLTSTAAYQVWRAQNLGLSQREIKKKLKKLLQISNRELRQLLTQSAEVGYDFDIKRLPQVQAIPFEQNAVIQQIVSAAVQLAEEDFTNITQTLGMIDPHGNALPLQDAYRACTDYAFKQVITGATDYNTAIRRATKQLADKGVRVIDYESGVHTSLEAAVRRNIMGGLGLMQEQITQANHDELGCDGWEISAHANSAPDHEPIQGRQYSDAAYTSLNNSLVRRIGTLNCGHAAFPVILGVSEPQYTKEELEKFRTDNHKGVTIDGKHYTGYEATQMQRKLERSMRTQKRRILNAEATGDKEALSVAQTRLQRLRQEYSRFSKAAGLRTENERAQVAGFGQGQAARARAAPKVNSSMPTTKTAAGASQKAFPTVESTPSSAKAKEPVLITNTPAKPANPTYGYLDVTKEWFDKATPNSHEIKDVMVFEQDGVVYRVDGVNVQLTYDKREKEIAELFKRKLGGDIRMMPKVSGKYSGVQTPDYMFRGERYDLKTLEKMGNDFIYNAVHKKRMQANNFIIDVSLIGFDDERVMQQIEKIYRSPYTSFIRNIAVVNAGEIVRIFSRA